MSAIEAMQDNVSSHSRPRVRRAIRAKAALVLLGVLALLLFSASGALAGQSATGELAFHPCTQCHPVTVSEDGTPSHELPIGMDKHEIELEMHDILGDTQTACLACHDDPSRNPGMLILPDGGLVDITGDISRVCQRCHFEKYQDWQTGVHGKDAPKCTASGCHDPHTPSWIYVGALPPFQGTGIEVRAVDVHEPFKPIAGVPIDPAVFTPLWLIIVTGLGVLICLGAIGYLVMGRVKR